MIITIKYDHRQNAQNGNWFVLMLDDMEWALSRRLQKWHKQNAKVTACRKPGKLELEVVGSDLATVTPLMAAFLERMKKDGVRVLITYDLP